MQLVNKTDSQASYFSRIYCHKTGTRPPSCTMSRQLTLYVTRLSSIYTEATVINIHTS